jgi:hypothetical protein
MKKTILIFALMASTGLAFAQGKATMADTVKKPVPAVKPAYTPDPGRGFPIQLFLNEQQVGLLTQSPEEWKALRSSELTGEKITILENIAADIRKNIRDYVVTLKQRDYQKWLAGDTIKTVAAADSKTTKKVKR